MKTRNATLLSARSYLTTAAMIKDFKILDISFILLLILINYFTHYPSIQTISSLEAFRMVYVSLNHIEIVEKVSHLFKTSILNGRNAEGDEGTYM